MPRLPDVRIDSWVEYQQRLFQQNVSKLGEATEFRDAMSELENDIPGDWPVIGGADQFAEEQRQIQARAEEQARQDEEERQRRLQEQQILQAQAVEAQQREAQRQQEEALSLQARSEATGFGIPSPEDIGGFFSGLLNSSTGGPSIPVDPTSDYDFRNGLIQDPAMQDMPDPLRQDQSFQMQAPPQYSEIPEVNRFAQSVDELNAPLLGPPDPEAGIGPALRRTGEAAYRYGEGLAQPWLTTGKELADAYAPLPEAWRKEQEYNQEHPIDWTTEEAWLQSQRPESPEQKEARELTTKAVGTTLHTPTKFIGREIDTIIGDPEQKHDMSGGLGPKYEVGAITPGTIISNLWAHGKLGQIIEKAQYIDIAGSLVEAPTETTLGLGILGAIHQSFKHGGGRVGFGAVGAAAGAIDAYINHPEEGLEGVLGEAAIGGAGGLIGANALKEIPRPALEGLRNILGTIARQPSTHKALEILDSTGGRLLNEALQLGRSGANIARQNPEAAAGLGAAAAAKAYDASQGTEGTTGPAGIGAVAAGGVAISRRGRLPIAPGEAAPVFYSQLARFIEEKMGGRQTPEEIARLITKKGIPVKEEELHWSGIEDWLKNPVDKDGNAIKGKISKEAVLDFLDQNNIHVEEVVKGKPERMPEPQWTQIDDDLWHVQIGDNPEHRWTVERQSYGSGASTPESIRGKSDYIVTRAYDSNTMPSDDYHASVNSASRWARSPEEVIKYIQDQVKTPTEYGGSSYSTKGGNNYRELLLTIPAPGIKQLDEALAKAKAEVERRIASAGMQPNPTGYELERAFGRQEAGRMQSILMGNIEGTGLDTSALRASYTAGHWSDTPNVLVHVRFDERVDAQGRKILHLDEVQSDWHQEGRREGYATSEVQAQREALTKERAALAKRLAEIGPELERVTDSNNGSMYLPHTVESRELNETIYSLRREMNDLNYNSNSPEEYGRALPRIKELEKEIETLQAREDDLTMVPGVKPLLAEEEASRVRLKALSGELGDLEKVLPSGPFAENAPELAMKRMIRWAAENGYDGLTWEPGITHANRWTTPRVEWKPNPDGEGFLVDASGSVRPGQAIEGRGFHEEPIVIGSMEELKDLFDHTPGMYGNYEGPGRREIAEERELYRKIWQRMQKSPEGVAEPRTEGMAVAYDTVLPNAVNKISKKFGTTVNKVEIPSGNRISKYPWIVIDSTTGQRIDSSATQEEAQIVVQRMQAMFPETMYTIEDRSAPTMRQVWGVDITPEMRRSVVEEGQPQFIGLPPGLAEAGAGGAAGAASGDEDSQTSPVDRAIVGAALGAGAVRLIRALPKKGPWAERLGGGPKFPEGAGSEQRAAIQAWYDQAAKAITESLASKGVAKQIRLRGVANKAYEAYQRAIEGEYEQLPGTRTTGPVPRAIPESVMSADEAARYRPDDVSPPEVIPARQQPAPLVDESELPGGAIPESGRATPPERDVPPDVSTRIESRGRPLRPGDIRPATDLQNAAGDVAFEDDRALLPDVLDPKTPVSRDQVAGFFGALFDDFQGNKPISDMLSRTMVKFTREVANPRMRHLQQVLEHIATLNKEADPKEWVDDWLRTNEYLAPRSTRTLENAVPEMVTPGTISTRSSGTVVPGSVSNDFSLTPAEQREFDRLTALHNEPSLPGEEPNPFPKTPAEIAEDARNNVAMAERPAHGGYLEESSLGDEVEATFTSDMQNIVQEMAPNTRISTQWWPDGVTKDRIIQEAAKLGYRVEDAGVDDSTLIFRGKAQQNLGGFSPEAALAGGAAGALDQDSDDEDFGVSLDKMAAGAVIGSIFGRRGRAKIVRNAALENDPVLRMLTSPTPTGPQITKLSEVRDKAYEFWRNKLSPAWTDQRAALQGFQDDLIRMYKDTFKADIPPQILAGEMARFDPNPRYQTRVVNGMLKPVLRAVDDLNLPALEVNGKISDGLNQFDAYLGHTHNIDVARGQGASTGGAVTGTGARQGNLTRQFPGQGAAGTTYADSLKYVQDFEARVRSQLGDPAWAEVQAQAQKIWDIGDHLAQTLRDSGLITEEAYKTMRAQYPHYVPTRILKHITDDNLVGQGKSMSVASDTLHELTQGGTTDEAGSYINSLLGSGRQVYAAAHGNDVGNAFLQMVLESENVLSNMPPVTRTVTTPRTTGTTTTTITRPVEATEARLRKYVEGIRLLPTATEAVAKDEVPMTIFVDGKKVKLAVKGDLGDITKYSSPIVFPVFSGLMDAFKRGATARNPVFLAGNMLLDLANYTIRETAREGGVAGAPVASTIGAVTGGVAGASSIQPEDSPAMRLAKVGAGAAVGTGVGASAKVLAAWGRAAHEFLPMGTMAGGVAGGLAGASQVDRETDSPLKGAAKVGAGILVGGALGAGVDRFGPGRNVWADIVNHEYRGDMARFLEQGGGNSSAYYDNSVKPPGNMKTAPWIEAMLDKIAPNRNESPLGKEVQELRRNVLPLNSPAEVARTLRDIALMKPVEALGERIELVPRVAAMRLAEGRARPGIQVLNKELANARHLESLGITPSRPSDVVERLLDDAKDRAEIAGTQAGRTTTLDFAKGGLWSKTINQIIPFFNVGVQSLVDPARAIAKNPAAYPATLASAVVAPMVAAEIANNWDEQTAKDYADVPSYIKDQGMVVMLPEKYFGPAPVDAQGNRHPQFIHWRFRELAPLAIATREFMQRTAYAGTASTENQRGWGEAFASTLDTVSPIGGIKEAIIQKDPTELLMNTTSPVVSASLQAGLGQDTFLNRRINSEQADERASPLSKALAGALGWRPSTVETYSRKLGTGYAGMLHGASAILAGDEIPRAEDTPLIGGLRGRFVKGSIGEGATRAQENVVSDEMENILKREGIKWRPSPSATEIQGVGLTRTEYARYQKAENDAIQRALRVLNEDPEWRAQHVKDKEVWMQRTVNYFREGARSIFLDSIPDKEWERRKEEAYMKGREPARSTR